MNDIAKAGWVFVGAGCGGVFRYLVQSFFNRRFPDFPWGTLTINVLGSLLIGIYFSWEASKGDAGVARFLIPTGLLGGFTTFSAFSAEANRLYMVGERGSALAYVLSSVLVSLLGCGFGRWLGDQCFR